MQLLYIYAKAAVFFCVWKWKSAGISGEHIRVTPIAVANSKPKRTSKLIVVFVLKKNVCSKAKRKIILTLTYLFACR